jgi:hypothetical protein
MGKRQEVEHELRSLPPIGDEERKLLVEVQSVRDVPTQF